MFSRFNSPLCSPARVAPCALMMGVLLIAMLVGTDSRVAAADPPSRPATGGVVDDAATRLADDGRHTLWIAPGVDRRTGEVDVLVNFHGSAQAARSAAQAAGLRCAVVSVNYRGLSSVYRVPFGENRQLFGEILAQARQSLHADFGWPSEVQVGRVTVLSFSAGFAAIREILKSPAYFESIDAVVLVDSLYCGYVGDGTDEISHGEVHPGLMQDFLRFARESASGRKTMIVTHCRLPTEGYASTLETADYLLKELALTPQHVEHTLKAPHAHSDRPLQLYRQAQRGGFELFGSTGDDGAEHVNHLRHLSHWLERSQAGLDCAGE